METRVRQLSKDAYPKELLEIPSPPDSLYIRGTWPLPDTIRLAVVGSRELSAYGKEACHLLIKGLSGHPISIVSGLALGTDTEAHEAALEAGLHTIAVPGSGLADTVIYPKTNQPLAERILKAGGTLLSEHEENHSARKEDFPSRNRIMVGLSKAVLIIEAAPQSGTLITARLTHEYNRELLCVPHRITDPHGYGGHLFMTLGATPIRTSEDILLALNIGEQNTLSI